MRVHDDIGWTMQNNQQCEEPNNSFKFEINEQRTANTLVIERHVFLGDNQSTNSLLPVSGREFVSQLGSPGLPDEYLDQQLVVLAISQHDFIDVTRYRTLV